MTRPNITLHIDRLVLHGFGAQVDRERIGAAVQRELTRLVAEQGVSPSIDRYGHAAHVDGGAFGLAPGAGAESIGASIARGIHAGMGPHPQRSSVAAASPSTERRNEGLRPPRTD